MKIPKMPYFRVLIHGTGIRFAMEGSHKPLIGFYTSRAVRAATTEQAIERAKASVLAVWKTQEYVRANAGTLPKLDATEVERISFWRSLKIPNAGHALYADE